MVQKPHRLAVGLFPDRSHFSECYILQHRNLNAEKEDKLLGNKVHQTTQLTNFHCIQRMITETKASFLLCFDFD